MMKNVTSQSTDTSMQVATTTASSVDFQRRSTLKMLLTPFIALLVSGRSKAFGMSVTGWKRSSAETRFSYRLPNGEVITIGVMDAINPGKGVHGVVISVTRKNRTTVRSAIRALELREFQREYYVGTRSFVGDLIGDATDLVEGWLKRGKKLWGKVKEVIAAGEEFLQKVCELLSALGLDICDGLIKDVSRVAAKKYLRSARAAAMTPNLLLSQRVALGLQQTIKLQATEADRRKVMLSLAVTILNSAK